MPRTVNGIGTSVCGARANMRWGGRRSFDAVECLVILYFPVFPVKAVHTFDWNGNQYRQIPIRGSGLLFLAAYWRRAANIFTFEGSILTVFLLCFTIVKLAKGDAFVPFLIFMILSFFSGCFGVFSLVLLRLLDGRNRAIRLLLGPHEYGSSDPATWTNEMQDHMRRPKLMYGTETFKAAVPNMLKAGRYSDAMWAARLATGLESRKKGEQLTDEVLADDDVQEALDEIRRSPRNWKQAVRRAR